MFTYLNKKTAISASVADWKVTQNNTTWHYFDDNTFGKLHISRNWRVEHTDF